MTAFIHDANNYDPWYAVRSKPRMEYHAAHTIREFLRLTVFLPQRKVVTLKNEIKHIPFFPGYLFIQVDPQNIRPDLINTCPGVHHLIAFDSELASIPHRVIEVILERINAFNRDEKLLNEPSSLYDPIQIATDAPSSHQKLNLALLASAHPDKRVRALLNILEYLQTIKDVQPDFLPEPLPENTRAARRKNVRFTRGKKRKIKNQYEKTL